MEDSWAELVVTVAGNVFTQIGAGHTVQFAEEDGPTILVTSQAGPIQTPQGTYDFRVRLANPLASGPWTVKYTALADKDCPCADDFYDTLTFTVP
jgi:hypothetical protein